MVPDTESSSLKRSSPESKNARCCVVNPSIGPPAPGGPPRTPGSHAVTVHDNGGTTCAVASIGATAIVRKPRPNPHNATPNTARPPGGLEERAEPNAAGNSRVCMDNPAQHTWSYRVPP